MDHATSIFLLWQIHEAELDTNMHSTSSKNQNFKIGHKSVIEIDHTFKPASVGLPHTPVVADCPPSPPVPCISGVAFTWISPKGLPLLPRNAMLPEGLDAADWPNDRGSDKAKRSSFGWFEGLPPLRRSVWFVELDGEALFAADVVVGLELEVPDVEPLPTGELPCVICFNLCCWN